MGLSARYAHQEQQRSGRGRGHELQKPSIEGETPEARREAWLDLLGSWLSSGRTERDFWQQTLASFSVAMRGDAKRNQVDIENKVFLSYLAAQMTVMAGAGKLGPLDDWLRYVRPQKPRTVQDMILALQDAAARGAPITITKMES
ncbi:MAG: hypothetical protein AAF494_00725 [Pseudomonadota bacterium]